MALNLRLNTILTGKKEGGCQCLKGEIIVGEDEGALRRGGGDYDCDKARLCVVLTPRFLSCGESRSSLGDGTPREGIHDS